MKEYFCHSSSNQYLWKWMLQNLLAFSAARRKSFRCLEECRKSGKSVKEFAKSKGIHEATYYNWRNKYVGKQGKEKRAGFAKLKINPTQATHTSVLFAEVKGIKIYQTCKCFLSQRTALNDKQFWIRRSQEVSSLP